MTRPGSGGVVELAEPLPAGPLVSAALAPTPIAQRTWGRWQIAALWVGMSVSIPTYMLASSMIQGGLTWGQSLLAVFLGNVIVLVPLVINGHAGTRYGIPFPVYARAAYGPRGAHLPALLRALVACGWFGIQTWIGGLAVHAMLALLWPAWGDAGGAWRFMGYGLPHYASFLLFWVVNLWFVWAGTESIKWMEVVAAPFLLVMGLVLLAWAVGAGGGLGRLLQESGAQAVPASALSTPRWLLMVFLPWVTAMVGYWATLALNIPDFTRYTRRQADQAAGQAIGLLVTMPLFAFIGLAVTGATVLRYGEPIWNPIDLVARLAAERGSPLLGAAALFTIMVATLSTNIPANVVAPANSFANLSPRRISFRLGGVLAGLIGIVILPWKLLDLYQTWLLTYSGLLGAVGGVIVADYLVVRRTVLRLPDLYRADGAYGYGDGINRRAVLATGAGIGVSLLGTVLPGARYLFSGAWFVAALVSFVLYVALMRRRAPPRRDS